MSINSVHADDARANVNDVPVSNVAGVNNGGADHMSNHVMSPIETTTQLMYIVHTRSPQEMQDMYYQQQQQQKRGSFLRRSSPSPRAGHVTTDEDGGASAVHTSAMLLALCTGIRWMVDVRR